MAPLSWRSNTIATTIAQSSSLERSGRAGDKVYTRDDRFVKSLSALGKQVVRCKDNTGAPWFDEDTDAVVYFLNEKYYKF